MFETLRPLKHLTERPAVVKAGVAVVLCLTASCDHRLADKVKRSPPNQWRSWAAHVIDYSRTNGGILPQKHWPKCVLDIVAGQNPWYVHVLTNEMDRTPYIWLDCPGGFQSIGMLVGSESFVPPPQPPTAHIDKIYDGVYLVRID